MKQRIENIIRSRTFYIILSIVLSIIAWLLVLSYTNPIQTRTLEIQITFLNENLPANLDLKDQTVTYPRTVTVTVSGRSDTISNLSTAELETTVDFSDITTPGTTVLNVSEPTCSRLGITIDDYYPKTIEFVYDRTSRKSLDIRLEYDNTLLSENYEYVSVMSELSSVPVSGFTSLLDTVAYIRVDLADSIEPGTLDSDRTAAFLGKYISVTGEDITHQFSSEKLTVNISVAKRVPITYSVTGTPSENFYMDGHSSSLTSVLLQGDADILKNVSSIGLGNISVDNMDESLARSFTLSDYLPEGVTVVGTDSVTVNVNIYEFVTRTFTINASSISTPGFNDSLYEYAITPSRYTVRIQGRRDDVSDLTVSSIVPTLDLLDKPVGVYHIPLSFPGLDTTKFTIIGEYVFTVTITLKQEEPTIDPSPSTPTPDIDATPSAPTPTPPESTPTVSDETPTA